MSAAAPLVAELRVRLLEALRPLVAGAPRVALLDFPAHSNVGDSAIWLGALALLRDLGLPAPCYCCDADSYDRALLARRLGRGTILFTGGGSFGDLWERHLLFRERVVRDFPHAPIVQLPESVHFERHDSLGRARATFDAHGGVTIMVRDRESLELVRREFRARAVLAPDVAFALGALGGTGTPVHDVLWLKRGDREDRWSGRVPGGAAAADWIAEPRTARIRRHDAVRRFVERHARLRALSHPVLERSYPAVARERLMRGAALLSSARVVVTDRLHGHIVSLLLGIPHVVLDNSYGKLHRFAAAWTAGSPLVRLASTPDEAAAHARELGASRRDG